MSTPSVVVGTVVQLWRYPVKSMQGEQVDTAAAAERGIVGDRAYAIVDQATGFVASAKHPRKWPALLQCRAAYAALPVPDAPLPSVLITLPNGQTVSSADVDVDRQLSEALGRAVILTTVAPDQPMREANRTPVDTVASSEIIREEPLAYAAPKGTFFDYAPFHILSTATLAALSHHYAAGRFDVRRFRPNIVVAPGDASGFVENDWIGRTIQIGTVTLAVIDPCPRCVVTTLAQGDLPRDLIILRTVSQHTAAASATLAPGTIFPAVAGVYAQTTASGVIARGMTVLLS